MADQDGRTYRREEEGATHKSIRPGRTVRSPSSMGFFHTKRMGSTPHTLASEKAFRQERGEGVVVVGSSSLLYNQYTEVDNNAPPESGRILGGFALQSLRGKEELKVSPPCLPGTCQSRGGVKRKKRERMELCVAAVVGRQ